MLLFRERSLLAAILWALFAWGALAPTYGQNLAEPANDRAQITVTDLTQLQNAMEADPGLDEITKETLRISYQEARSALDDASELRAQTARLGHIIETGRDDTEELKRQLENLPAVSPDTDGSALKSIDELQAELESIRLGINSQDNNLSEVSAELEELKRQPISISSRLPNAREELADIRKDLETSRNVEQNQNNLAKLTLLQAQESRLLAELDLLSQQQQSHAIHEDLVRARRNLMRGWLDNEIAKSEQLAATINERRSLEAQQLTYEARRNNEGFNTENEEILALLEEVKSLAADLEGVVEELRIFSINESKLRERIERLDRDYEFVRQQIEFGGNTTLSLLDIQSRLPTQSSLNRESSSLTNRILETRLAALNTESKLQAHDEFAESYESVMSASVDQALDSRKELLEQLEENYRTLTRSLGTLRFETLEYASRTKEVRQFMFEQTFWMKSSAPIGGKTLSELPKSFNWFFSASHIDELTGSITKALKEETLLFGLYLLSLLILISRRRHYAKVLLETRQKVRHISTDNYKHTLRAVWVSFLFALPALIATHFIIWVIGLNPDASSWLQAVAQSLKDLIGIIFSLSFLIALCHKDGIIVGHFRWQESFTSQITNISLLSGLTVLPLAFIALVTRYAGESEVFDSLGRLSFMGMEILAALFTWVLLKPSNIVTAKAKRPTSPLLEAALKTLVTVAICTHIILTLFACTGRLSTGIHLGLEIIATFFVVVGSILVYYLLLRWFQVNERKIALKEAIEKRRAKLADQEEETSNPDEIPLNIEEPEEADLDSISEQTRHLLGTLFVLLTAISLGYLWAETAPVVETLEKINITSGLSLMKIFNAAIIGVFGYIAFRDLPALLELGILRSTKLEFGTRSAITTLCQYFVIAGTLLGIFHIIEIDWSRFGWIAAALSVGIGFGLQEIVANFVCGLILLFELPVKVGDVVTVDGQTGTVVRIRMRATTIINWDRKELVVPNKAFITGALLNWTLTSSLNRLIITVGVAYGSDTEKARRIMIEAAKENPIILDDPSPFATFEEFSDSCLTLRLRVYLPNMDNRLSVLSDMHSEIDRRFKEEGLEIAFPQRDLNIRSWPSLKDFSR
ncbi:mechanosensitive ion channel domain-containing protein [Pelagicoccus mobilis]|uniref:Mechanosensitive ion channel n=1 Tax=Pelagicoccus mobilis TaxID=415221 RepID=A0A934RZ59_9BACT|nr:mechanosensitive ion channel domain-containing protein [Pelagicoccus mobilis]MBK1879296.1 mechanosensitive ion channel [Pelagicoccus mobilis]